MKFYQCSHCKNIVAYVQDNGPKVSCCGEEMKELVANTTRTILASIISVADQVVYEMGDLLYHCLVLLAYHNITPGEMLVEMAGRKVEEEK